MDADELAEALAQIRERTAGDDEAYHAAVDELIRRLYGEGDSAETQ